MKTAMSAWGGWSHCVWWNGPSAASPAGILRSPRRLPHLTYTTINNEGVGGKQGERILSCYVAIFQVAETHIITKK